MSSAVSSWSHLRGAHAPPSRAERAPRSFRLCRRAATGSPCAVDWGVRVPTNVRMCGEHESRDDHADNKTLRVSFPSLVSKSYSTLLRGRIRADRQTRAPSWSGSKRRGPPPDPQTAPCTANRLYVHKKWMDCGCWRYSRSKPCHSMQTQQSYAPCQHLQNQCHHLIDPNTPASSG